MKAMGEKKDMQVERVWASGSKASPKWHSRGPQGRATLTPLLEKRLYHKVRPLSFYPDTHPIILTLVHILFSDSCKSPSGDFYTIW